MFKLVMASMFACFAAYSCASPTRASATALDLVLAGAEGSQEKSIIVAVAKPAHQPVIVTSHMSEEINNSSEAEAEVNYVIQKGDTLIRIAKNFDVEWPRIYYKNTQIEHPDKLIPGMTLVIPNASEDLAEREIPESMPVVTIATIKPKTERISNTPRGVSDGNRYTRGYCTWYVKNMRPDLPNNLGNAETWAVRAAAQGIATGTSPRVGAVGQRGNHVVYVEGVNNDGTILISEMNFKAWNVRSTRAVPANYFTYIY